MALDINLCEGYPTFDFVIYRRREDVEGVLIIAGGDAAEGVTRRCCFEELARLRGDAINAKDNKDNKPGPCPSAG